LLDLSALRRVGYCSLTASTNSSGWFELRLSCQSKPLFSPSRSTPHHDLLNASNISRLFTASSKFGITPISYADSTKDKEPFASNKFAIRGWWNVLTIVRTKIIYCSSSQSAENGIGSFHRTTMLTRERVIAFLPCHESEARQRAGCNLYDIEADHRIPNLGMSYLGVFWGVASRRPRFQRAHR